MKKYSTEQRKYLLSFFRQHPDRQFSVEEIAKMLRKTHSISVSAIYRNIKAMVEDGSLQRYAASGSRKSLYQYIGENGCSEHIHLKCEKCGLLFHMDDHATEAVLASAMNSNFNIDKRKTILYGLCEKCD